MLKGRWWRHGVTLPIGLLARQASDLSRLSPLVDAVGVDTSADRKGRVLRNRTPSCRFGICLAAMACTLLGPPRYFARKGFSRGYLRLCYLEAFAHFVFAPSGCSLATDVAGAS